ncbi:MAG: zinc ribbon domain-containing protein [Solobacterium sp.]|nr:zinc ribbon domain-containing protein [Solobacterium sp.]
MSKYCTNCGKPLGYGVRYCTNCGFELPEPNIDDLELPKPSKSILDEPADGTPGTMTSIVNELNNMEVTEPVIVSAVPEPEPEPEPKPVPVSAAPAEQKPKKASKKKKKPIRLIEEEEVEEEEDEDEEIVRYKHRKWPWILILLIALCAGGTWWLSQNRPDLLDKGLQKITDITGLEFPKFDKTPSSSENIPAMNEETARPEMTSDPSALGNAIGTVRVKVTKLHIRTQPATAADLVGDAREGATYTYYAAEEGEGYTWYRIGRDQWIADQGEWLEITKFAE